MLQSCLRLVIHLNPAVVSEIDGEITMGKIKRGNREIIVTSKTGEVKRFGESV